MDQEENQSRPSWRDTAGYVAALNETTAAAITAAAVLAYAFIRYGNVTSVRAYLIAGVAFNQNFSTQGRNSTSHVQALRGWFATCQ